VGPRRDGGTIRVRAALVRGDVELTVEDDGLGASADALPDTRGPGLRTLRERLALETKWRGEVETTSTPGEGFRVRVRLARVQGANSYTTRPIGIAEPAV
jgi:signal transduction histidine kinase